MNSLIIKIIFFLLFLSACFFLIGCEQSDKNEYKNYQWPILEGFPKPQVPNDNPMTLAKVNLGKHLFYDVNLSANQQQSCGSCHIQEYAFAEPLVTSTGSTGGIHRRNAPALVNIAYNKTLTWAHDGLTTIEQQLLLPMFGESPIEMGITGHEKQVLSRFQTTEYQALFAQAFPDKDTSERVSFDNIIKALASFVRSLISLQSSFDKYAYAGQDDAISASALRGMQIFFDERFECHHCHGGFNFTQSTSHEKQLIDRRPFHNTGLYDVSAQSKNKIDGSEFGYPHSDTGLAEISTLAKDNGRFRAPTLRNIEVTAPYMHDGSLEDLPAVIDFYAAGGRNITEGNLAGDGRLNPLKSPFVKGFEINEQEKADLIAFLLTLTDEQFLTDKKHAQSK